MWSWCHSRCGVLPRLGRFLGVKVVGVLLAVGGVALAVIAVLFLGGYGRAVVFIVGGGMTVYGVLLWTASPSRRVTLAGRGQLVIGDPQHSYSAGGATRMPQRPARRCQRGRSRRLGRVVGESGPKERRA